MKSFVKLGGSWYQCELETATDSAALSHYRHGVNVRLLVPASLASATVAAGSWLGVAWSRIGFGPEMVSPTAEDWLAHQLALCPVSWAHLTPADAPRALRTQGES
jgi:hypothetical protein